jgi:hypothetical protein
VRARQDALKQLLLEDLPDANDFGNEVIPAAKDAGMRIQVPSRLLRRIRAAGRSATAPMSGGRVGH